MAKPTLTLPSSPAKAQMPAVKPTDGARPAAGADPAPYLGAAVIVKTVGLIAGQNEHAATITKVLDGDLVNVMLMPGEGQPYPVLSINRASGSPSWRWPQR